MKKITVFFRISTKYLGSTEEEKKEFEFCDNETETQIDHFLSQAFDDWVLETHQGGYEIVNSDEIPDED